MSAMITGIGNAVPTRRATQCEAAAHAEAMNCRTPAQRRTLNAIYGRSGIETRHTILAHEDPLLEPAEQPDGSKGAIATSVRTISTAARMRRFAIESPKLATEAAGEALSEAHIAPSSITHIVTASCTGFTSPGFDIAMIDALDLSRDVQRTHIGYMGCHAAINALRIAKAIVDADEHAVVLVCCVELCTLHFSHGWDPQRIVANALFADGAAAAVLQSDASTASSDCITTHRNGHVSKRSPSLSLIATGSQVLANTTEAMSWRIGGEGFEMMLSHRVPELICEHLPDWITQWLDTRGLQQGDIDHWAVHPGGPRILDAVQEALCRPDDALDASRRVLRDYGNMSSATLLFILRSLQRRGARGGCCALAFGPGLTIEAALLSLD